LTIVHAPSFPECAGDAPVRASFERHHVDASAAPLVTADLVPSRSSSRRTRGQVEDAVHVEADHAGHRQATRRREARASTSGFQAWPDVEGARRMVGLDVTASST